MKKLLKNIPSTLQVIGLGILAGLWNWKTIAFYIFCVYLFFKAWVDLGFTSALIVIPIAFFLKFLGRWL